MNPLPIKILELRCWKCRKLVVIRTTQAQYDAWQFGGKKVQEAFPDMTPEHREMLISNTCGACFSALFPPEEDENA